MNPLINKNSVLFRLPKNLNSKQRLVLDGIRYSVQIADQSFLSLLNSLFMYSAIEPTLQSSAAIFANAWSIVDSLTRLDKLLNCLTELHDQEPIKQFREKAKIKRMRNHIQHLDERFDKLVELRRPTWGTLTWIRFEKDFLKSREFEHHTLTAGSFQSTFVDCELPTGKIQVR